ncbi:hypothetical protein F2P81_007799 [Scophthalmus maximus]|uniref:Uncharacterized protein n=1 Tax=Scophthalmus maximus TaxID=52904 RepID=A0A6A4T8S3_SCOMX|nr:hypothetical protein F2P81_007799 [Scophthalmus maximus]
MKVDRYIKSLLFSLAALQRANVGPELKHSRHPLFLLLLRRNNDGIDRIPKTTLHCNEYIEQGGVVVAMCDKPNSVIAKYRQHIGKQAQKAKSQKGVNSFTNMDYSKTVKRDQRGKLHGTPPPLRTYWLIVNAPDTYRPQMDGEAP